MSCPQCGSAEGSFGRLCPSCISINNARRNNRVESGKNELNPKRRYPNFEEILRYPFYALVAVVLCIFFAYRAGVFGFGTLKKVALSSVNGSDDPCIYKKRCVITFLAPWCPACHASIGLLQEMRTQLASKSEIGIKVVVGSDAVDNLRQMASTIGGQVFLDPDGEFASSAGVRGVPAWWVIDERQKIVARGAGLDRTAINGAL